ncbi:DUF4333 domain-containing protein [Mycobacteroides abscessus]|uniref:DUF4333 domain-containing protein n=1 Tax=Mycobacteroides abscessus TaxID=36809 RepID=UPI0019D1D96C|nr:DUF4333 domain-containing protein [Mycobacteroides abscessus]MBN7458402.1 DUF4333 domain-containing protein [Mycobacteroides abscessus subsp. abscessus]
MRQLRCIAAIASVAISLAGCHVSVDVGKVNQISAQRLAQGLRDAAKERQNILLQSSECSGPLDGKVNATQHCTVVDDEGTKYDVLVTTTSVEGTDIKFHYTADPISKGPADKT